VELSKETMAGMSSVLSVRDEPRMGFEPTTC
jgi:hypothetical protein